MGCIRYAIRYLQYFNGYVDANFVTQNIFVKKINLIVDTIRLIFLITTHRYQATADSSMHKELFLEEPYFLVNSLSSA